MVWREMPVMRSISRWVAPPLSSVQMVVCRCGFKTFNLGLPRDKGAESNVLPVGPHGAQRTMLNASDHRGLGGAVWVAISGALWVAAGVYGGQRLFYVNVNMGGLTTSQKIGAASAAARAIVDAL